MIEKDWTFDVLSALIGIVPASISAFFLGRNFLFNKFIHKSNIEDQRIVLGRPIRPDLNNDNHQKCVWMVPVFNKSKNRKVVIESIKILNMNNEEIKVKIGTDIDQCGNVSYQHPLVGIIDQVNIFIRKNDGKRLDDFRMIIKSSYSEIPQEIYISEFGSIK